ncbi:hypothetical protein [Alkalibacillus salilacus]|uniref:Uncharacterized protein n=1 Tax=Alkalibacillus salilacus TaxID=284582 RepID=A0ABT9VD77_9BACI|nr:hypothetical protein [Alkalibacillus salilacus]MDQ0158810.1 hypothetical protein [Alkalibacillus salilacus]
MAYQVIRAFRDKQDNKRHYRKGDTFPEKGEVSQERLDELLSKENDVKAPLIEKVGTDEVKEPEEAENELK